MENSEMARASLFSKFVSPFLTSPSNFGTTSITSSNTQSAAQGITTLTTVFTSISTSVLEISQSATSNIATSTNSFFTSTTSVFTSASDAGPLQISQSSGSKSANTTPTYTSISPSLSNSNGHLVTGTMFVSSMTIVSTSPTVTLLPIQHSESNRRNSPLVPAVIGSLAGVLAFSVGIFLYLRHRRRRRALHMKVTPLTETMKNRTSILPNKDLEKQALAVPVNESETSLPSIQSALETRHSEAHLPAGPENENMLTIDDHEVRLRVEEMRVTVGRMMEHVHRLEAQIGGERNDGAQAGSETSSLDEPPPTYVSS